MVCPNACEGTCARTGTVESSDWVENANRVENIGNWVYIVIKQGQISGQVMGCSQNSMPKNGHTSQEENVRENVC